MGHCKRMRGSYPRESNMAFSIQFEGLVPFIGISCLNSFGCYKDLRINPFGNRSPENALTEEKTMRKLTALLLALDQSNAF